MQDAITVITVTRQRPRLLQRAIASVQAQDYPGRLEHLIIIDDCPVTLAYLESFSAWPDNLAWHLFRRRQGDISGAPRLGFLRNAAVQLAESRWIAFLDDDNEFEPNHLSSLVNCALLTGHQAVHSHMQIFHAVGAPYVEERLPWSRDLKHGRDVYRWMTEQGVFQPGSNIVRDRADPLGTPDPVRSVDTGEWLFERELLLRYRFCEHYTADEIQQVVTEDDKLLQMLIENRVAIGCTHQPTLRYYLGGYSNTFDQAEG